MISPRFCLTPRRALALTALLSLSAIASPTYAADYYVAASGGADTNSGTLASPFRTIQKAASVMLAGDTCFIRAGTYRETVRPAASGTASAPLRFQPYNGEAVVISGCDVLTGWQVHSGAIYKANLSYATRQVFVNGVMMDQARYPNRLPGEPMISTDSWAPVVVNSSPARTADLIGTSKPANYWVGGQFVGLCGLRWISVIGKISASSGARLTVTNESAQFVNGDPTAYRGAGVGFVFGLLSELDIEREWHWQSGILYLRAPGSVNPAGLLVEARVRDVAVDLSSRSYIQLTGLGVTAATLNLQGATGCVVDACSIRYPRAFYSFYNGWLRSNDILADNWEGTGVAISGTGNTLRNSYIAHSWGDGVSVWGAHNVVDNCLVEDTDWLANDGASISVQGTGHDITDCTLRETARSAIVHRLLQGGFISGNRLSHGGILCDDLGLTYTWDTAPGTTDGTEISYNWLHDNYAPATGPAIYVDNVGAGFLFHHNAIWNCDEGIRLNLSTSNTEVYNNTVWACREGMTCIAGNAFPGVVTRNNLAPVNDFKGSTLSNNQVVLSDRFVNAPEGNYTPKTYAPMINVGVAISGITDGSVGTPDIGAYEAGLTAWTAGTGIARPILADTAPQVPPAPRALALNASSIRLDWVDASSLETGYLVERCPETGGAYITVATLAANATTYTDTGLSPLTGYQYRIRALSSTRGNSIPTRPLLCRTLSDGTKLRLEAERYNAMLGVVNGGAVITNCDAGDWIRYDNLPLAAGYTAFRMRLAVSPSYVGRTIEVRQDSTTGTLLGSYSTVSTGGFGVFAEISIPLLRTTGTHTLFFLFKGGSGVGNFDWFQFEAQTTPQAPAVQQFQAETAQALDGAVVSGTVVGYVDNGDWLRFDRVYLGTGTTKFKANLAVAAASAGQLVEVRLDASTGPLIGSLIPQSTGSFGAFQLQSATLTGATGVHDIYVKAVGANSIANFDYFRFEP